MKCIYCEKEYHKENLYSLFIKHDLLCPSCRKELKIKKRKVLINDIKVNTYFDYEGIYKSLLLQFKECYDEALSEVFLYKLEEYLRIRYFNYHIMYVPSSEIKLKQRGFNHLELMFKSLGLKEAKGLKQINNLSQENKNYSQRESMINNYIYEGKHYKKVLLVDDVLTTGSSIYGAYKAIEKHIESIDCLVLGIV